MPGINQSSPIEKPNEQKILTSLRHLTSSEFTEIPVMANMATEILAAPHIEPFNFCMGKGLKRIVENLLPMNYQSDNGYNIEFTIEEVIIDKPRLPANCSGALDQKLYPKECIERGSTYRSDIVFHVVWRINNEAENSCKIKVGEIPIMVKSSKCHLANLSPAELLSRGELTSETGGYFIINGICRVIRLLIANRRNYPFAMTRETWKEREANMTEKGVLIRCVADDESSCMNILHYLTTGAAKLELKLGKEIFLLPLFLCFGVLCKHGAKYIGAQIMKGRTKDTYLAEKVNMMMRKLLAEKFLEQSEIKNYIGSIFRFKVSNILPKSATDEEVCDYIFNKCVFIHLKTDEAKFNLLCHMTRKLYALVSDDCVVESVDLISMEEVHVGGHIYLQLLKEKLQDFLTSIKVIIQYLEKDEKDLFVMSHERMRKCIAKGTKISSTIKTFIATGSLKARTDCGIPQVTGLTITMEHLNRIRDLSHLRGIHRGSYFVDMKLLGPRRLTSDAWGFICPVHTPDGAVCGLLNHLALNCEITSHEPQFGTKDLETVLLQLGMLSLNSNQPIEVFDDYLDVILDGELIGNISKSEADDIVLKLRSLKVNEVVNKFTELVLIKQRQFGGQFPGMYLFTGACRMVRRVINIKLQCIEYIGSFEQLYLNIAIVPEDIEEGIHTHIEMSKTTLFSNVGKLVPFSDCNPNPRNMYQCQMGKQTMGTPVHNFQTQTSGKLFRLQYPQVPLVRNQHYDDIKLEEFCMGFNVVLAIVSYTGYDMEDAMVINKCSMERGLAQGQVYKSEFVDLSEGVKRDGSNLNKMCFQRDPSKKQLIDFLDANGLPPPGTRLKKGDPYFCIYNSAKNIYTVTNYPGEDCVVDKYTIMSSAEHLDDFQRVNIAIRIRRDPIVGDKFASRSGQKGILSQLYPAEDMPFSERGISPDIIFNPHGIPSRMTAGKLLELIAGKGAAEHGLSFDSSPFQFNDEYPAYDYFGEILQKAGFNRYGEDVLYSGIDGRMLDVQIFEGIVYYQRLRHMTSDKYQVRSTGSVDPITQQPIKGRKRGGAIRFGEMERDCLIAHGAPFTLKDRLLDCSDSSMEFVCTKCGCILAPKFSAISLTAECAVCGPNTEVKQLNLPHAFKYLVTQLASMSIKVELGTSGTR